MLLAGPRDFLRLLLGEAVLVRHLRAAGELEPVVNPENERVHRTRRQFLLDELGELIHAVSRRSRDAESAHGQSFVCRLFRRRQIQSSGQQQTEPCQFTLTTLAALRWKHGFHAVTLAKYPKRLIVWKRQTLFQERQRPFCRRAVGHSTPLKW